MQDETRHRTLMEGEARFEEVEIRLVLFALLSAFLSVARLDFPGFIWSIALYPSARWQ